MSLPDEQRSQLVEWLLSNMPYHVVRALVKKEFHTETSMAAISAFYNAECTPALITRRTRAVETAKEIAAEAGKNPGRFDEATIDALKQQAFELAISPGADPRSVKNLFSLVLKARDQDIAERELSQKIRAYEDKIKAAKANVNKLIKKGGVSKKAREEIEQELNLL
jgi:hypothetical protein